MMNYYSSLGLTVSLLFWTLTSSVPTWRVQRIGLLRRASNSFSQNFYQRVCNRSNVVYSPYSIHSAFSMTSEGARGATHEQMQNVLELTDLGAQAKYVYRDLNQKINATNDVKFLTSNALFVNPSFHLNTKFAYEVKSLYGAHVEELNFQVPGGPTKQVNDFVAMKTENLIQDMLAPGSIDDMSKIVLVNTVFFNGTWQREFPQRATRKGVFYQLNGATKHMDMMHVTGQFNYKNDIDHKAHVLELQFKGKGFSLYIILPHAIDGITSLETSLTNGVEHYFQNLNAKTFGVSIPKFKVETQLTLNDPLIDMGMTDAFDSSKANFSGITARGGIHVNFARHNAVLEITESGTVAAAATVISSYRSVSITRGDQFEINHPFLFFLRDRQTCLILFQGKFSG